MCHGRALYLASRSPRRAQLLDQIGIAHEVVAADVDEVHRAGERPITYVERIARTKAQAGAAVTGVPASTEGLVLGADTAIALQGRILGKPWGAEEIRAWLLALSGRCHEVLSAVAVTDGNRIETRLNRTAVTLRVIEPEEIEAYMATGEPEGKAGGYAIQGRGAVFVEHLAGSYSAVMGLPLFETEQLLRSFGRHVL